MTPDKMNKKLDRKRRALAVWYVLLAADFLLMFLRTEVFSPSAAADRRRKFWKVCRILLYFVCLLSPSFGGVARKAIPPLEYFCPQEALINLNNLYSFGLFSGCILLNLSPQLIIPSCFVFSVHKKKLSSPSIPP